jgi:hypothetical protein
LWFYVTAGGTSYSATNAGGFATPDLDTLQNSNKAIIDDALAKIKSVKGCTYQNGGNEWLVGFEMVWSTSTTDQTKTFGDCSV